MPEVLVTGPRSPIIQEFVSLVPGVGIQSVSRAQCDMSRLEQVDACRDLWISTDRIVLAHGELSDVEFCARSPSAIYDAINVNLLSVVRVCEIALSSNQQARIVVLGSESATKGSYDIAYWLAKAALHEYVRNRRLDSPEQQLVCVAPSLVIGSGMTRQKSEEQVAKSIQKHPKQRGVKPVEVARMIHYLLFVDDGYTTNTVLEMNGGKFARR